jgi:hypothetical protein
MEALLVGVEKVTHLVTRCNMYEALFRVSLRDADFLTSRERSLVGLYVVILEYLSTANKVFDVSTVRRLCHAMLNPHEVQAFVTCCEKTQALLDTNASICERIFRRAVHDKYPTKVRQPLAELQAPLVCIDTRVDALFNHSETARLGHVLRWISGIPYETNQRTAYDGRTPGTA